MNEEQFQHRNKVLELLASQTPVNHSADALLSITGDEMDCFEITMPSGWPYIIHDSEVDGVFYFKDERFRSHHYACRAAYQEAVLASGGTKCLKCRMYYRDVVDGYCKNCTKLILKFPDEAVKP
jgi:hypothetical protein